MFAVNKGVLTAIVRADAAVRAVSTPFTGPVEGDTTPFDVPDGMAGDAAVLSFPAGAPGGGGGEEK